MEKRQARNSAEIAVRPGKCGEKILSASDLQTALDFVQKKQNDGTYQFFRGQENSHWLPLPAYYRLKDKADQETAKQNARQFVGYTRKVAQDCGISYSNDELIGIAQHYGIPTSFLDLTTDPVVAASFACPPNSDYATEKAAIFLYSEAAILEWKEWVQQKTGQDGLELICIDVANLWRLESQSGLFLWSCVSDICNYCLPDRIEFSHPQGGFVDANCVLYPQEKSPLETQLDLYFDLMSQENAKEEMHKLVPDTINVECSTYYDENTTPRLAVAIKRSSGDWILDEKALHESLRNNVDGIQNRPLRTLPDSFFDSKWKYRNGELLPHHSWFDEHADAWLTTTVEKFQTSRTLAGECLKFDLTSYGENTTMGNKADERWHFEVEPNARRKSLVFDIHYPAWRKWQADSLESPATKIEKRWNLIAQNLWDGIRSKPVDDKLMIGCLNQYFTHLKRHFDLLMQEDRRGVFGCFGKEFIDHEKVEFAGIGGHSQTVRILHTDLARAVRDDFSDVIEVVGEQPGPGFPHLRQMLFPQYIFDFDEFVNLHYLCVLPYQAIKATISSIDYFGFYFNPRQIKIFGLA